MDIIRYHKGKHPEITKVVGFTFPKLKKKKYVVKVDLEFKNFYKLEPIIMSKVKPILFNAFNTNMQTLKLSGSYKTCTGLYESYIRLSQSELKLLVTIPFENGVEAMEQIRSRESLLISWGDYMWKYPIRSQDKSRLNDMSTQRASYLIELSAFKPPQVELDDLNDIQKRIERNRFTGRGWLYYPKVKYANLPVELARHCIGDLVMQVCTAVKHMHTVLQYCHRDLRLENICFNEKYEVVLIDLDRCCRLEDFEAQDMYTTSCVYDEDMAKDCTADEEARMQDWSP